jgi:hypothetical protein
LYSESQREQQSGTQALSGGVAPDCITESNGPGVLIRHHAVDKTKQQCGDQCGSYARVCGVPQVNEFHAAQDSTQAYHLARSDRPPV